MARRQIPIFLDIEDDRRIDSGTDAGFLLLLKTALLLSLKEKGIINLIQYRYAEETLKGNMHQSFRSERKHD